MITHVDNPIYPLNPVYTAYLVRFWQDTPSDPWRAAAQSVTNPTTQLRLSSV